MIIVVFLLQPISFSIRFRLNLFLLYLIPKWNYSLIWRKMVQNAIKHWVFVTNTKTWATWGTTLSTSTTCRRRLNHTFILFGLICPYSDRKWKHFLSQDTNFPCWKKTIPFLWFHIPQRRPYLLHQTPGVPQPVLTTSRGKEGSTGTKHRLAEGRVTGTIRVHWWTQLEIASQDRPQLEGAPKLCTSLSRLISLCREAFCTALPIVRLFQSQESLCVALYFWSCAIY